MFLKLFKLDNYDYIEQLKNIVVDETLHIAINVLDLEMQLKTGPADGT